MVIKNASNGKLLSNSAIEAKTLAQKTFGLIFSKKPETMLFRTRFGIHTLFMKYPIDVLVLDKANTVIKCKTSMKPNTIFLWNPKYDKIIELPENTLKKSETNVGNKIAFI